MKQIRNPAIFSLIYFLTEAPFYFERRFIILMNRQAFSALSWRL